MKKLYLKSTVHPSPSPPLISDQLSVLPAAIFTLTLSLSPQDKELLAYLLSSSTTFFPANKKTATTDHSPIFNCSCFQCYTSYWVRWDSSPNRQLIHEIIDAFEDALILNKTRDKKTKKDRKKKVSCNNNRNEDIINPAELIELNRSPELGPDECESVPECEEGPVRKLVSFLWSVWT